MACEGMVPCGAQAPTGRALGGLQSCGSTTASARTPVFPVPLDLLPLDICLELPLRLLRQYTEVGLVVTGVRRIVEPAAHHLAAALVELCHLVSDLCQLAETSWSPRSGLEDT